MKRCRDCGEDKPLTEFSPAKKARDGRTSYCRECLRQRHQKYRDAKNGGQPVRRSAARASSPDVKWCPGCQQELAREAFGSNRSSGDGLTAYCKPCHNAKSKQTYTRLYGSTREYHLRQRYGVTREVFDALVDRQGGVCAVCRTAEPVHVDHDHVSGWVRGVLCFNCNGGLGQFKDRADVLRSAIDYLERTTWTRQRVRPGVFRLTSPRPGAARSPSSSALQPLICSRRG